ncbi:MAG: flagellar hook-basal body complex protein FliE [Gammaproteobacteria bacterium]
MTMNSIDAQAVLAQMRALASQAQGIEHGLTRGAEHATGPVGGFEFGDALKAAVDKVNENQQASARMTRAFEAGEPGVDLAEVMVAIQKASISFEAATQVRNRLVSAYQDIMNMPL